MSYLHCPTCHCAYNVAKQAACPTCGVRAGAPLDPTDDVVAAAEQLARAVARATPAQLAAAQAALAMREAQKPLPAPSAIPTTATSFLRAVRAALAPSPHVVTGPASKALLTTVALALLTRLPRPRAWAETHVLPRMLAARAQLLRS